LLLLPLPFDGVGSVAGAATEVEEAATASEAVLEGTSDGATEAESDDSEERQAEEASTHDQE
jgi:hypothetical protein